MTGVNTSPCRGCGDPIEWITMKTGKRHPVNLGTQLVVADPKGPLRVVKLEGEVVAARLAASGEEGRFFGKTSHFASCRMADSFRKAKAKR